jgi:hypothetical protein
MNRAELLEFFDDAVAEARRIIESKNHDYAGRDGENPFANFTRVESLGITSTERGFLVRLTDKISRLSSFCESGEFKVDESLRDTCLDIVNYSVLYLAYMESQRSEREMYAPKVITSSAQEGSQGIVYFALGFKDNGSMPILDEAIQSAESVKKHSPNIPITIFTDEVVEKSDLFDHVIPLQKTLATQFDYGNALIEYANQCQEYRQKWWIYCGWKPHLVSLSPYDKTLYLDTDTFILQPIDEIFEVESEFAIALDVDTLEGSRQNNGGVYYFNGARGRDFVRLWAEVWFRGLTDDGTQLMRVWSDQSAEEPAAKAFASKYGEDLDVEILPYSIWNVRPSEAHTMPLEDRAKVKILQSRFHYLTGDEQVWKWLEYADPDNQGEDKDGVFFDSALASEEDVNA